MNKYIVDSIASMIFWVPVASIFAITVLRLQGMDLVYVAIYAALSNFFLGGLYGKYLNRWRERLGYR